MTNFSRESPLLKPLKLPCGAVLSNRIAKAAMTERLARNGRPNELHESLYRQWSKSGSGLLITGNMLVDSRYKEASGNIVLEEESVVPALKKVVTAGTLNGNHLWAQINHAGRQSTIFSTFRPIAPSAVWLKKLGLFAPPRAMQAREIADVRERFIKAAEMCAAAGFTGIQIHAAHGYLLSQFLSPLTNRRTDDYGGSIQNRARLLMEIVDGIRSRLGNSFPISVKLNSADFQRGGFEESDALIVIEMLDKAQIDLFEISGGTYQNLVFLTQRHQQQASKQAKPKTEKRASTLMREAYFLDFAKKVRSATTIPLMVTGGFRTLAFCESVLEAEELELIGFARPFLIDKNFPRDFVNGITPEMKDPDYSFGAKPLLEMAEAALYDYQIEKLAREEPLDLAYNPYKAVLRFTRNELVKGWF